MNPPATESVAKRTALIAGGTGLVGSRLLRRLCSSPAYDRVVALARRPPELRHTKLEVRAAEFDALDSLLADLADQGEHCDVFCCLGTTIRSAGSQKAFRRVDYDYILALAEWARRARVRRLLVVSALGADPASRVFYNRVKGETERVLQALGLRSLVLLRPSLLDGKRAQWRLGERAALLLARPLAPLLPRAVRPVKADDVAAAMLAAAMAATPDALIDSARMHGASHSTEGP